MRLAGQLAIASGIVGILATAVLLAFYLLDAPQAVGAIIRCPASDQATRG
jgi:hypothetical protein